MKYVVYHLKSKHLHDDRDYASLAAAKAVLRSLRNSDEWEITTRVDYDINVDHEYIGGRGYKVKASTPRCCDPNSDLYWSM